LNEKKQESKNWGERIEVKREKKRNKGGKGEERQIVRAKWNRKRRKQVGWRATAPVSTLTLLTLHLPSHMGNLCATSTALGRSGHPEPQLRCDINRCSLDLNPNDPSAPRNPSAHFPSI
jgi:hypothetical protein